MIIPSVELTYEVGICNMYVRVSSKYFKNYYVSNRIALLFKITITSRLDWK